MTSSTTHDYVARLTRAMATLERAHARIGELEQERHEPLAIIGMACRFPGGADDPSALWRALEAGVDGVREAPSERWGAEPPRDPPGTRWAATLDDIAGFDAELFGISPREAARLDPQHRLLLEVSWEALEAAGLPAERLMGTRAGVFVGITTLDYQQRVLDQPLDIHSVTGTALCFAAGRLSYALGLQGPSMSFDTACSSSLVAVHQACHSLRTGESEVALVGGVNLMASPTTMQMLAQALSPSGRCMSFDARANGYVRGEGCGVVVLKRRSTAERDGDRILALVRGSAVNHDGRSTGLTAPNVRSQQRLLQQALASARVRPDQVDYVETHGTGTALGDPIEIEALRAVLGAPRPSARPCFLGAIKTNLGHLEAAAGIAGLIKTVLVLQRGAIPKNLHFEALNPMISLAGTPFEIPTRTIAWPRTDEPRFAGVSSFGMSGTNAHVVLEEAPREPEREPEPGPERSHHLMVISGRTEPALRAQVERYAAHLRTSSASLANLCHTANVGRSHLEHRVAVVAGNAPETATALEAWLAGQPSPTVVQGRSAGRPKVAFLFTGQGSQHVGMGQALYATEPVFREAMQRCARVLDELLPRPLLQVLYAPTAADAGLVDATRHTQPLLVALEWSLVQLWAAWGVEPDVVMGHSVGEHAAAIVAGVLSLEDGLRLVASRGRRIGALPPGGVMVSVQASAALVDDAVAEHGGGEVSVAAYNGPRSVVVSGSEVAVDRVLAALERHGVSTTRLTVSHAFHSPLMEPVLDGLARDLEGVKLQPPQVELVTNVTGTVAGDEIMSTEHWLRHTRAPVRFASGMETLAARGCDVFVEVGPQPVLLGLGRACLPSLAGAAWLPSLRRNRPDHRVLLHSVGELHARGVEVSFAGIDRPHHRRRVELPTYAWQRRRHWIEWSAADSLHAGTGASPRTGAPPPPAHASQGERRSSTLLDARHHPYLEDHRVFGRVVAPGALLVTTLLAAIERETELEPSPTLVVEDLLLPQALALDEPTTLHATLEPRDPHAFGARLSSALVLDATTTWRTHAIATLRATTGDEPPRGVNLDELRARLPVIAEAASEAYATLERSGLVFGPAFRTLAEVGRAPGEALARLRTPSNADADADADAHADAGPLHPCLLDACFQVFGAALPVDPGVVVLPFGCERLRLHARPHGELWCHARLRSEPGPNDTWVGDLVLLEASGRVVATIEGHRARAVAAHQLAPSQHPPSGPFYALAWRPASPPVATPRRGRRWLILADRGGLGRALAERLEADGEACIEVTTATRSEPREPATLAVDPTSRADVDQLLATVGPVDGVVCLWALDDASTSVRHGCGGTLSLAQALAGRAPAPPLWLVTRGAQGIGAGPVACAQAALWGLGRVLATEHPELACMRVDLDPSDASDASAAERLHHELSGREREAEVAWRAGRRRVPRLIEHVPSPRRTVTIQPDATYLVTGGWGALGLHVAGWLAAQGARHLVLVGRRAPGVGHPAADSLAALRAQGVDVELVEADMARAADVERAIERSTAGGRPLRGVFHAAGVVDDGLLRDQSLERVLAVLAPKLAGALHLDAALEARALELDAFVLFSSAAAVTGPSGQGSYAAANATLDALAHDRRARGRTCTSIAWGPWQGAGMAAGPELHRHFAASGIEPIEPEQGLEILTQVLAADETHVIVLPGSWARTASLGPLQTIAAELRRAPQRPPERLPQPPPETSPPPTDRATLRLHTRRLAASVLGMSAPDELDETRPLAEQGLDSLMAVELRNALASAIGRPLPATLVFDHPTVAALGDHLAALLAPAEPEPAAVVEAAAPVDDAIAIVGMSCRFPGGAHDLASYWTLLSEGIDAIREIPPDRWDVDALYDPDPETPGKMYTRWGGFLDGIDRFDARFFGITPREATSMDPQQRMLLEVGWEALEHAAIAPERIVGTSTGVFVGIMFNDYAQRITSDPSRIDAWFGTGNASSVASGRLSYQLGLKGPSVTIDTACSSSLVAVHLACQSLRAGETELALAGGATVVLSPAGNIYFSQARALASDGRCKSFSAAADGVSWSEGCGIVVLKRLADALASGDRVLAVIRGSAVNQDGRSNGLSAPNGPSQVAVIEQALRQAGVSPLEIDYVETHGTGTPLGDPVEAQALDTALGAGRPADRPLLLSAVKSNLGHTQAAAGVAGLIKAVLALQHEAIPPSLHARPPSSLVDWSRIQLVSTLQPWPAGERPRRAGVSSFGISGTNAHLVLEQAPTAPAPAVAPDPGDHLLILSARSAPALRAVAQRYVAHLETTSDALADVCHTAATGRNHFEHRLAVVADRASAAAEGLRSFLDERSSATVAHGRSHRRPTVAFLFTGQGSQHAGMGRALLDTEPVFARAMQRCAAVLDAVLPHPLLEVLDPPPGSTLADRVDQTEYTQPLLVALEWSLVQLWRSLGIEPDLVMGHSVGEYSAAIVAGVLSLEDGLRLVAARGRRMQALPAGGVMAAVQASPEQVEQAVAEHGEGLVSVAAYNGPLSVVISGIDPAAGRVLDVLARQGISARRLVVSHAFHSPAMDPMLDGFARDLAEVELRPPRLPLVSNVTGVLATDELAAADYWLRHTRAPVAFARGMQALRDQGCDALVEIGPRPTLLGMGRACVADPDAVAWLPSLRPNRPDRRVLRRSLGELYVRGAAVTLGTPDDPSRRRVMLPSYPWQQQRFWIDDEAAPSLRPAITATTTTTAGEHPLLGAPVALAHQPDARLWQAVLDPRRLAYLHDHRVEGEVVMPGTAYLEMVLAALAERGAAGPRELLDVRNHQAMIFAHDEPRVAQLALTPEPDDALRFQISSRPASGRTPWQLHCSGRVRVMAEPPAPPEVEPLGSIRARCPRELDAHDFYARLGERGNHWGPAFQGIQRLWIGEGEVLAQIDAPPDVARALARYQLHPALSDACGHAFAALQAFDDASSSPSGAFVGAGAREARVYAQPSGGPLWSHARLRVAAPHEPDAAATTVPDAEPSHVLVADIRILDASGALVAELHGARFWYLDPTSARRSASDGTDWLYALAWEPQPYRAPARAPEPSTWIVLDDGRGVGEALAAALEACGDACVRVVAAADEEGFAVVDDRHVRVRPAAPEELAALLDRVAAQDRPPCRGIVHAWGSSSTATDPPSAAELAEATPSVLALHLVQALAAAASRRQAMPRLWLVTRGAQAVLDDDPIAVAQAPVWGLGGVISQEHPELWGGLIDLDPRLASARAGAAELTRLVEELRGGPQREQVALRGDVRHVARLARWHVPAEPAPPLTWRDDASYLITGGLGELGLAVARWMVEQGARQLILAARTPLPPRSTWDRSTTSTITTILELEARGAVVRVVTVDVADEVSMARFFEAYEREGWPPIRGIVHAAGVVSPGPLDALDAERVRSVLRPKTVGSWLLHQRFAAMPLEFMVLFSSASALLPSPLLGAYPAANAFLDALAHHRRRLGLPAISIDWGPWAEVGMAASRSGSPAAAGAATIPVARGVELMGLLMRHQPARVGVLPMDWASWRAAHREAAASPLYERVLAALPDPGPAHGSSPDAHDPWPRLSELPEAERAPCVRERLTALVAGIARLALDEVDPDAPLSDLGLDSLMAVELRQAIERATGMALPLVHILTAPSLDALVTTLCDGLSHQASNHAPSPDHWEEGEL